MPELPSNLEDLKSRTDEERINFLQAELELSFTFAEVAQSYYNMRKPQRARESVANAEKGYSTMLRFLTDPKHAAHIPTEVSEELSAGLKRLRQKLDDFKSKAGLI